MHPIRFDVKFYNVILMGVSFMLLFTAFQTMSIIEKVVLDSLAQEGKPEFKGVGYTSLAIIYGVLAVANWAAPSVLSFTGPKYAMIGGAFTYLLFIASFLAPQIWLLYLTSALVGLGAACIWTGQGNFLTMNSNSTTMGRNSGIFWALLQSSLLFGNLFVFIQFKGADHIDANIRRTVFIVLLVVGALGFLVMFLFRKINAETPSNELVESIADKPVEALRKSFQLFLTKDMLLLSLTFFYTGIELGFFSGVYGSAVSSTLQFGSIANSLIGINGMFIGVGEILGGALFGLMGAKTNKYGRDPIVLLGFVIHMITFYIIFINLPFLSPLFKTNEKAFIPSNAYAAILCSFLLGFGDSCFNTQIYSLLGTMYPENSGPAFALFKFIQSLGATAIFVYSLYLQMQWHIVILIITGVFGTFSFCLVEWKVYERLAMKSKESEAAKANEIHNDLTY